MWGRCFQREEIWQLHNPTFMREWAHEEERRRTTDGRRANCGVQYVSMTTGLCWGHFSLQRQLQDDRLKVFVCERQSTGGITRRQPPQWNRIGITQAVRIMRRGLQWVYGLCKQLFKQTWTWHELNALLWLGKQWFPIRGPARSSSFYFLQVQTVHLLPLSHKTAKTSKQRQTLRTFTKHHSKWQNCPIIPCWCGHSYFEGNINFNCDVSPRENCLSTALFVTFSQNSYSCLKWVCMFKNTYFTHYFCLCPPRDEVSLLMLEGHILEYLDLIMGATVRPKELGNKA